MCASQPQVYSTMKSEKLLQMQSALFLLGHILGLYKKGALG